MKGARSNGTNSRVVGKVSVELETDESEEMLATVIVVVIVPGYDGVHDWQNSLPACLCRGIIRQPLG